ncbi:phage tail tape measure protein [Dyella caseinilytica]|uniref:Phage tail tape measure protein n=1 Tax=Dyella caseinilytica TaxID=1849581 RepID=A0ABX7GR37_9GAMM|nr:phage tail tape measure protein [Dyella caseinilytica]QRN52389.1 phage tail tape measure protein [Dyella caseinilytica]GGA05568.1 phage tail tape measure protein [Dyella caseinilytica]
MADIASLGIQVTSSGVAQAQTDLDKLTDSGTKAEAATDKLGKTAQRTSKSFDNRAIKDQQDALAKLIGQIAPTVAALDRLDKMQTKLNAFKSKGVISGDDWKAYSQAIDDTRAKISGATEAMGKFTLGNAAARREIGLITKDIATGQWGRLEQSLATLAAQSGLVQVLFSGLGVSIMAAAAEIGVFVYAANDASNVQNKFNESLAQTGGYAGIATQGMSQLSGQVAGANGNLGKANEILIALAGNGKVTSTSLLALGQAAMDMSTLTGQTADKAAASVTNMFDGTAASAAKANEQYHFLTVEIYDQIAALEQQGETQRAVEVAAQAFHDAISPRLDDMHSQVTGIAAAWDKVKESFTGFWTTFKQGASLIGGTADTQTQIYALMGQKQTAQDNAQSYGGRMLNSFGQGWTAADEKKLQDLQAQLQKQMQDADDKSQASQMQTAGIAGQAALDGYLKQYQSQEQKREAQIVAIHNAANKAIAAALAQGDQALADKIMQQEAAADAAARASWEKKPTHKADPMAALNTLTDRAVTQNMLPNSDDTATNKLLADQVKQLQAITDAGARAIEKGASIAAVQGQVGKAVAATNEYYSKQADILQQKDAAAMAQYQASLDKQNAALQRSVDAQTAAVGMGDKEYQQQQKLNAIYQQGADALTKLNAQRSAPGANTKLIDQQIAAQEAATQKQVQIVTNGFDAMDKAQGDWVNGWRKASADFIDQGKNVAGQTESFFTSAFGNMTDKLAEFATTGKLDFKGFISSVLSDLAKLEIRLAASKALSSLFGGGSSVGSIGSASQTGSGLFTANAKGGVYDSPSLSAFSGQIVSSPTMFAFAKGAGLMGEAGPEAILPLTRGSDGKLGVQSSGGGAGGIVFTQNISIDNSGNASVTNDAQGANATAAKQLTDQMQKVSMDTLQRAMRPGGILWRSKNG